MVYCCAYGCQSSSVKKEPGVSFHSFPAKDQQRSHLWVQQARIAYSSVKENTRLCSKHFEDRFIYHIGKRAYLQANAVPTIFQEIPGPGTPIKMSTEENVLSEPCRNGFGWEVVEGVAVPFIRRTSGVVIAELNMLKKTLFHKHLQVLNGYIFFTACPTLNTGLLFHIIDHERKFLEEISDKYCESYFYQRPYSLCSGYLIQKKDAVKLYDILETFYQIVTERKLGSAKCGFLKIDDSQTPVPFVDVEDVGLVVPLFFFECPEVTEMAFTLKDHWSVACLKLCCKLLSVLPTFYERAALRVVKLDLLKTVLPEFNEPTVYRTLPSKATVAGFKRQDAIGEKSELEEINNEINKKILKFATSMPQIVWKRGLDRTIIIDDDDDDDEDVSAAKKPKLEDSACPAKSDGESGTTTHDTVTIIDSSGNDDDDEFVEQKIKIEDNADELRADDTSRDKSTIFNKAETKEKNSSSIMEYLLSRPLRTPERTSSDKKPQVNSVSPNRNSSSTPAVAPPLSSTQERSVRARTSKDIANKIMAKWPKIAPNRSEQKISPVLQTSTSTSVSSTRKGPGTAQSPENTGRPVNILIKPQTAAISTHIPTVMAHASDISTNVSFSIVPKPAAMVQQSGSVVNSPGLFLQQPIGVVQQAGNIIIAPGPVVEQSNLTMMPTETMLPQQPQTRPVFSSSSSSGSTSSSSSSSATTARPLDSAKINLLSSNLSLTTTPNSGFINILPKTGSDTMAKRNSIFKQLNHEPKSALSTYTDSKIVTQTSNNPNSMVVLQPGNVVQSCLKPQITTAEQSATAPFVATQNGVLTPMVDPSGIITGFLTNLGTVPQMPNPGHNLTNQSVIVINPNNVASKDVLLPQTNFSNFQNVIATPNGFVVLPNAPPNPTNQANIVAQPNQLVLQNNYTVNQKIVMPPDKKLDHNISMSNNVVLNTKHTAKGSSTKPSNRIAEFPTCNSVVKSEPRGQPDLVPSDPKNIPIKTELLNKKPKGNLFLVQMAPRGNAAIKTELESVGLTLKKENEGSAISSTKTEPENSCDVIDLTEDDDVTRPSENDDTNSTCTIISDENMEKLVMVKGTGREVLYKVNEIPECANLPPGTCYKVVRLKMRKRHTFLCVSKDPFDHDNLLISVLEIIGKLFPTIQRKKFMSIVKEMDVEVFTLNTSQKAVLRRFYAVENETDVSDHLYFLYKKFITIYGTLQEIFKMMT